MKKILKVKISRTQTNNGTHYEYPPEYDPKKFQVITYETMLTNKTSEVISRGNNHEYVIGVVDENDAPSFLLSKDITEITRSDAELFIGEDLNKSTLKIVDHNAVIGILAKSAKGQSLSQQELDLIDDTKQNSLLKRSKTLNEVLNEHGIV